MTTSLNLKTVSVLDEFLRKVSQKNEPLEAFRRTQHFATLLDILTNGIEQQIKSVIEQIRGKNDPSMLPDNYQNLNSTQLANLKAWIQSIMPKLSDFVSQEEVTKILIAAFEYSVKAQYQRWGLIVKSTEAVDFKVTNPNYLKMLEDQANYLLKWSSVDDTTLNNIINYIAEAKSDGMTIDEVASGLVKDYVIISESRGMTIARTETANAMGQANLATMKENNVPTKSWVGAGSPTDELCLGNIEDGLIPVDEPFSSGHMCEPGHPNCECYTEAGEINLDNISIWDGA